MAIAQQAQQFNRQQPSKPKPNKFAHTANTKYGMGDNYGTGIRAPIGKMRSGVGMADIKSKLETPPKKLA